MRNTKTFRAILLLAAFSPALVLGSTKAAGWFSFDNLIPAGAGPGVNVFNIFDLTGDPGAGGFALPPDFPIFTSVTFQNSKLTLDDGVSPFTINLGDIAPGQFGPTDPVQFPDTQNFLSATFTATLSTTNLVLFDSSVFVPSSIAFTAVMLPSSGPFLQAGTDFAIFNLSDQTPEPSTLALVGLGLVAAFITKIYCNTKPNT